MRALLVGESNPYGTDPRYALYPAPKGCAGERLCRLVMGLESKEYIRRFDRVNVCGALWSDSVARQSAATLLQERQNTTWVLLGRKVARAFAAELVGNLAHFPEGERELPPWMVAELVMAHGGQKLRLVTLPHPSGLCREWNVPGSFERARQLLHMAGAL